MSIWRAVLAHGGCKRGGSPGRVEPSRRMLPGRTLRQIFAAVLVIAALRLLSQPRKPKGNLPPELGGTETPSRRSPHRTNLRLAGVGGGVFAIPIMYSLFRFPLEKGAWNLKRHDHHHRIFRSRSAMPSKGGTCRGFHPTPSATSITSPPSRLFSALFPWQTSGPGLRTRPRPDTLRKIFALLLIALRQRCSSDK